MAQPVSNVQALKRFFEAEPHGRELTMAELRELGKEDRAELAKLAAAELGLELKDAAA